MPEILAAPAAPAAAPSAPAVSTPSTPAPQSPTPAVQPSPAAPETTQQPAAPDTTAAPVAPKGEPKRENFPEGADGERDYMRAQWDYEEGQIAQPVTEDVPVDLDAEAGVQKTPEELAADAEAGKVEPVQQAQTLTPESVKALEDKHPELKELFDKVPEIKGAFYETSRKLAKAQPIADLFPDLKSAEFSRDTANGAVEIRSNFLRAADDPTQIEPAFDRFMEEFREYDDKGQPMVDASGQPVYGKDFEALVEHTTDRRLNGSMEWAKERIASGKLSDKAASEYQTYADAIAFIKQFEGKSEVDLDRPDVEDMSSEQKDWFDRRDAELRQREEQAGLREKQRNSEASRQARVAHETKINSSVGEDFGKRLKEMVQKDLDAGVKLPRYALESSETEGGPATFALNVYKNFMAKIVGKPVRDANGKVVKFVGGDAKLRSDLARLEALPMNEESARQRITFFNSLREQMLPELYEAEKNRILGYDRQDRQQRSTQTDAARAAVQPEPRASSAPRAQALSVDAIYEQATAEVEKENQGKYMTDRERQEAINRKVGRQIL